MSPSRKEINRQVITLVSALVDGANGTTAVIHQESAKGIMSLLLPVARGWIDSQKAIGCDAEVVYADVLSDLENSVAEPSRRNQIRDWVAHTVRLANARVSRAINDRILDLVSKSQSGDRAVTEEICRLLLPVIVRCAQRDSHGKTDPDTFTQETAIRILRNYLQDAKSMRKVKNWVACARWMTKCTIVDSYRRHIRERKAVDLHLKHEVRAGEVESASDCTISAEATLVIKRAIQRLPAGLGTVVKLSLDGCPIKTTAKILGIPKGTVKSRLFNAREKLYMDSEFRRYFED